MSKLLLFSLLTFSTVAVGQAAINPDVSPAPGLSVATPVDRYAHRPQGLSPFGDDQTRVLQRDRVCLRIHAFIFKTDDDRVPQLVRETTCMPAIGRAKEVGLNAQPKLIPADGGNHF